MLTGLYTITGVIVHANAYIQCHAYKFQNIQRGSSGGTQTYQLTFQYKASTTIHQTQILVCTDNKPPQMDVLE